MSLPSTYEMQQDEWLDSLSDEDRALISRVEQAEAEGGIEAVDPDLIARYRDLMAHES